MFKSEPRSRLEQLMRRSHMSHSDFLTEYSEQASRSGAGNRLHISDSQVKRWLRGGAPKPRAVSCRVLEYWWKEPVERLLGPPEPEIAKFVTQDELVTGIARESVKHAIEVTHALDSSALEYVEAAAMRVARAYYVTPPLEMLSQLAELRDAVHQLLNLTQKPRQQTQLYLVAGQVCGLLSSVAGDLGHLWEAGDLAHTAHTYGSIIDHPSLCAWARALQVAVNFWSGKPRVATKIAEAAIPDAPRGTARVRLHSVNARALALLGARDEVEVELRNAADELDSTGGDSFLDEVGGELAFDRTRRALCAGAAYVALGDGAKAKIEARAALALFAGLPEPARWGAGEIGARLDLGTAMTITGDLAGTVDAIAPALALAPGLRTVAVTQRMHRLGSLLATPRYKGAVEAAMLGEQIENFTGVSRPARTQSV
jgi:hypothetical protein